MIKVPDESFVEKMLYRLIKKHIAGTTMSSALTKAKELNKRNLLTSITFLSGNVGSKAKARYITTTYIELIRRIARLGLKANVHIPLDQIGWTVDKDVALSNLEEIVNIGNKYGVFIWASMPEFNESIIRGLKGSKGFGLVLNEGDAKLYVDKYKYIRSAKIMFNEKKEKDKKWGKNLITNIDRISGNAHNIVLSSTPESVLWKLLNNGSKYKKLVVFEFGLGYSNKKIKKAVKKGAMVSINVPFGKDWVSYASKNVTEGYMHFLVKNLLGESDKGGM